MAQSQPHTTSGANARPYPPSASHRPTPTPQAGSPAGTPRAREQGRLASVRFLTVAEVARLMRVSKMTVYRLVHAGDLQAVRVGRSFRVPESAVQAYLREAFGE